MSDEIKTQIESLISAIKQNENNLAVSERYEKMLTEYKRKIEVNREPFNSNKFDLSDINQMADELCQMEAKIDDNSIYNIANIFIVLLKRVSDRQRTLLMLCYESTADHAIRYNHQQLIGTLNAILKNLG